MEPELPIFPHPTLAALSPRLELVQDCWHLLAESDGTDRRDYRTWGWRTNTSITSAARAITRNCCTERHYRWVCVPA